MIETNYSFTKAAIIGIALCLTACEQAPIGEFEFAEGQVQHVVRVAETDWQPCPPNLPAGCEIAAIDGNPTAPDLFTVRFRVTEEFAMAPHTHPKDERVTIISGLVSVAFSEDATREDATQFGPGDYYVNSRDVVHSVWIDAPAVLQITGIGPWEADFVN